MGSSSIVSPSVITTASAIAILGLTLGVCSARYRLGSIDRYDRKYEAAEANFMAAQNNWWKGEKLRSHPFNGACMYRLGCVALDEGKVEAAM